MGKIYGHRWSDWLRGIPWYFYLVFTWVKLPLLTLMGLLAGFPLLFRRMLGDGRYLLLFWFFFFFLGFSFLGGKFTRYYTVVCRPCSLRQHSGCNSSGTGSLSA